MFFNHLMPMKTAGMTGTASEIIWRRKNMLTALSFTVSSSQHICRMPLQLAKAVMCMAMECTYHKLKAVRLHELPERSTFKRCWKGAADIVCTADVFSEPMDKAIDDSQRVLRTRFTRKKIRSELVMATYSSPLLIMSQAAITIRWRQEPMNIPDSSNSPNIFFRPSGPAFRHLWAQFIGPLSESGMSSHRSPSRSTWSPTLFAPYILVSKWN